MDAVRGRWRRRRTCRAHGGHWASGSCGGCRTSGAYRGDGTCGTCRTKRTRGTYRGDGTCRANGLSSSGRRAFHRSVVGNIVPSRQCGERPAAVGRQRQSFDREHGAGRRWIDSGNEHFHTHRCIRHGPEVLCQGRHMVQLQWHHRNLRTGAERSSRSDRPRGSYRANRAHRGDGSRGFYRANWSHRPRWSHAISGRGDSRLYWLCLGGLTHE